MTSSQILFAIISKSKLVIIWCRLEYNCISCFVVVVMSMKRIFNLIVPHEWAWSCWLQYTTKSLGIGMRSVCGGTGGGDTQRESAIGAVERIIEKMIPLRALSSTVLLISLALPAYCNANWKSNQFRCRKSFRSCYEKLFWKVFFRK